MEFKDRVANKPNRVKLTYEGNGESVYATVVLDDEPIEEGTPLNKKTFDQLQSEFVDGFEDETHKGCYYRIVDGKIEWINPPMENGVEYCTTKRFNGKPVYTTYTDIGVLPNNSSATIRLGNEGDIFDNILNLTVMAVDNDGKHYPFPQVNSKGELRGYARMGGSRTVYLTTFADLSSYTGKLIIEYTKA